MSDLFFTTNMSTVVASNVSNSEKVTSITLQTYAGQTDLIEFRIGSSTNQDLLVYSTDPNITMSFNETRGFAPALNYSVGPDTVGSTIFVKLSSPLNPTEGDRTGQIIAGNEILSVNYFLASTNEGDTNKSQAERFAGDETFNILEQFEIEGEAVIIYRYDPITKPIGIPAKAVSDDVFASLFSPAEWCNPNNSITGYRLIDTYPTKAFIGDTDLEQNFLQNFINQEFSYSDTSRLLLPPDFQGFNPSPIRKRVLFGNGITTQSEAFQQTQWTVKRNDGEYAVLNIRKQSYFRGQFLYFACDLARINHPAITSDVGFLPFNQLYDSRGKIIHYVKSWSETDRNDPYCNLNDEYCFNAQELGLDFIDFVDGKLVIKTWTGE